VHRERRRPLAQARLELAREEVSPLQRERSGASPPREPEQAPVASCHDVAGRGRTPAERASSQPRLEQRPGSPEQHVPR
jgi:hypothetical protein